MDGLENERWNVADLDGDIRLIAEALLWDLFTTAPGTAEGAMALAALERFDQALAAERRSNG